jgi:P4 family phage/plasmid primase-like protien
MAVLESVSSNMTLGDLLKSCRSTGASGFTHTSLSPSASYYIPTSKRDTFYQKYKEEVKNESPLHLTERHYPEGPFIVDLDFRFNYNPTNSNNEKDGVLLEHYYTPDTVYKVVKAYFEELKEYFKFEQVELFVMEKQYAKIDKGKVKDGIHIIVPEIVSKPGVQYIIRENIMKNHKNLFDDISVTNSIGNIVDSAIIYKNNWFMYGSTKPNAEIYKVTSIYTLDKERDRITLMNDASVIKSRDMSFVELFSLQNKIHETTIENDKRHDVKQHNMKLHKDEVRKKTEKKYMQSIKNSVKREDLTDDQLQYVEQLVKLLNKSRADDFESWINLGWCLRNLDYRLCDVWNDFSRNSLKWKSGDCPVQWEKMKDFDGGLKIGSLVYWVTKDDPKGFEKLINSNTRLKIQRNLDKTHYTVATVFHNMFADKFVYYPEEKGSNGQWYEFKQPRWVECRNGYDISKLLSTKLANDYADVGKMLVDDAQKSKICFDLASSLKNHSFKENIMKECRGMFKDDDFKKRLDEKKHLLGFDNGVFDLELMEFREGRPEDYITYSTGYDFEYIPYDETDETYHEMMECIKKILVLPAVREYMLTIISTCLDGRTKEQSFYMLKGVGSNGKSKLMELLDLVFGDYLCFMPITNLTSKRPPPASANPELYRTKGSRIVVTQEPEEDCKFNGGYVKEMTGGDKLTARPLYGSPETFRPQFKLFLTLNQLPRVSGNDGGMWRRIKLIEFLAKFKDNPDSNKEYEYEIDKDLDVKFDMWKLYFMSLLIDYYKEYKAHGVKVPKEVEEYTRQYQQDNDIVGEFITAYIRTDNNPQNIITGKDAYERFKNWVKIDNPAAKAMRGVEFRKFFEEKMPGDKKINLGKGQIGWKNYEFVDGGENEGGPIEFVDDNDNDNDDDDDAVVV